MYILLNNSSAKTKLKKKSFQSIAEQRVTAYLKKKRKKEEGRKEKKKIL